MIYKRSREADVAKQGLLGRWGREIKDFDRTEISTSGNLLGSRSETDRIAYRTVNHDAT